MVSGQGLTVKNALTIRIKTISAVNWCIDRSLCDKSTKIGTNDC